LKRQLVGLELRSGCFGEEINLNTCRELNDNSWDFQLVA
jgi:hypothetical protein